MVKHHVLCIVGAGPGGLQLGHLLLRDASQLSDYVIFEQSGRAGNFFTQFPVHRMLISLNKRYTRSQSTEFRMRHDWNSLLGSAQAGVTPVTHRTPELYPHADILAEYLQDFAAEQVRHIEYDTQVTRISKYGPLENGGHDFELEVSKRGQAAESRICKLVILATGLSKPNKPTHVVGADLLTGYEQLPASGRSFANQSVLVWGFGNAAHETARELQKYTQEIHLLHRRPGLRPGEALSLQAQSTSGLPRFAFFTHYPGDVRTVTMQIYDSYLLKALDVKLPYSAEEEPVFLRCLGEMLCIWVSKSDRCGGGGTQRRILPELLVHANESRRCAVELGAFEPSHSYAMPVVRLLEELVQQGVAVDGRDFAWGEPLDSRKFPSLASRLADLGHQTVEEYLDMRQRDGIAYNAAFELRGRRLEFDSGFLSEQSRGGPLLDLIAKLRPRLAQDPLRYPFHAAVRCLGWKADLSLLDSRLQEAIRAVGKYPKMTGSYQAPAIPGLFFAGALSHGRDYRRSAGGFIHGFRYTARALYRILKRDHTDSGWPNRSFNLNESASRAGWMQHILVRINEAAGPYQMFGELVDMVLFSSSPSGLLAHYLEEVPQAYAHEDEMLRGSPRLVLSFLYGKHFSALDLPSPGAVGAEFAELSAFLHPRLELFEGSVGAGYNRPILAHSLVEDVFTEWGSHVGHVDPLFRFLEAAMSQAAALLQVCVAREEL